MKSLIIKISSAALIALAICVLAGALAIGALFSHNLMSSPSAQALRQSTDSPSAPEIPDSLPDQFYMLLLGVDSSEQRQTGDEAKFYNGSFRSDTIIVANVSLSRKKISLCSLERDIKTKIDGYESDGWYKLNAAYALGGVDLMKTEAEQLTGLDIPYYAIVDMDGLTEIIDAFGGVEVNVEKAFFDEQLQDGINKKGKQTLNGQQAVLYSRSRYAWAEGDFARARHQREVLTALAHKVMATSDLFALYGSAEAISTRVATNLPLSQVFEAAAKLRGLDSDDVYSMMTPTESTYEGGVSYQVLDKDAWEDVLDDFVNLRNPKALSAEEAAKKAAESGDPQYADDDNDGVYDADADGDGLVGAIEWHKYRLKNKISRDGKKHGVLMPSEKKLY